MTAPAWPRMRAILVAVVLVLPACALPPQRAAPSAAVQLHALLEEDLRALFREFPVMATLLGVAGRHDALLELTQEALARRDRHDREMLERALAIPRGGLQGQDRLSLELFIFAKRNAVAGQSFPMYRALEYMDQFNGPHLWMPVNQRFTPFRNAGDYRNYIARLSDVERAVDEAIALARVGLRAGWANARPAVERIPAQIDAQLQPSIEDDDLASPLRDFPTDMSEAERAEIARALHSVLRNRYRPALARLRSFVVEELIPHAPVSGGIGALPRGRAYYDFLIRSTLDANLDAEVIHALGQQEVLRLRSELTRLAASEGFDDPATYVRGLLDDPRQSFASADELLAAYQALALEVEPKVAPLFHQLPKAKIVVQPISAAEARADVAARYQPPSIDGQRPAAFMLNTIGYRQRFRFEMMSLFLHEAVPGHHLQVARAMEIEGLPRWRQLLGDSTAYSEGWALYAEKLGIELGLYTSADSRFGRLRDELWRAARLVVDTGIHAKAWTREEAVAYMMSAAALQSSDAEGEIDRYFVWPAQALGYKIGELKILELRRRAEQTLGARFDIRDFHAMVIDHGSLPLPVLERLIDDWIARGGGPPQL